MPLEQTPRSKDMEEVKRFLNELASADRDEAVAILEELGAHPEADFRCHALDGLKRIAPERAGAMAVRLLDDPVGYVRFHGVYSLWEGGLATAAPAVARVLEDDPDELVRSFAAFYLGVFGDESVLPALRTAMERDTGEDHEGTPIAETARRSILMIDDRLSGRGNPNYYPSLGIMRVD